MYCVKLCKYELCSKLVICTGRTAVILSIESNLTSMHAEEKQLVFLKTDYYTLHVVFCIVSVLKKTLNFEPSLINLLLQVCFCTFLPTLWAALVSSSLPYSSLILVSQPASSSTLTDTCTCNCMESLMCELGTIV